LIGTIVAAMLVTICVVAEIALPGKSIYHAGWYNVAIAALVVAAILAGRKQLHRSTPLRVRLAVVAIVAGTAVAGLAAVASGLLGPDNQTFVGAPGQRMHVESLGVLVFPIASSEAPPSVPIVLEQRFGAMALGERARNSGSFILWTVPHSVVYVEARDLRGNTLTVTQPSGSAFLSPVLLMEHRQTIAGMDLPFDSFNVPAARRIVKAVMFDADEAAMLLHGGAQLGAPAVLFAVDDENERALPHGIGLSAAGRAVRTDGLSLRGIVESYPAVEVVAAPNLLASAFGIALALAGLIALWYDRFRPLLPRDDRANVSQHDAALG
jgi:hypothetical protein